MCIIICKPIDKKLPQKQILKNCFINNDDGAGFSFVKDNRIYISKGYSKFKPFFRDVIKNVKDNTPAILHFRIASVGKVSDANCHPFIISEDKEEINKTVNCTKKPVFAHNGTLPIKESNGKSDTRQYAHIIGDPLIRNNIFRNGSLRKILAGSIGLGRMAFMNRKGEIRLFGDFEEEDGLFFSNHSYKYRTSFVSNYKGGWKKESKGHNDYSHGWGGGYGGYYDDDYYPIHEKKEETKDPKLLEDKTKDNDGDNDNNKELNAKIIQLNEDDDKKKFPAEKYPVAHTECEICGKEEQIYYYPKIDTSLCPFCFSLYCGEYETKEVIDDKNENKDSNKRERRIK